MDKNRQYLIVTVLVFLMIAGTVAQAGVFSSIKSKLFGNKAPNNEFLPLEKDAWWQYESVKVQHDITWPGKETATMWVIDLQKQKKDTGTYDVFTLRMTSERGYPFLLWDDLYLKNGNVYSIGDEKARIDFQATPGAIFPVEHNLLLAGLREQDTNTITYLGLDTAVVPAGTFKICRKYKMEQTSYRTENEDTKMTLRQSSTTFWFAKGVGIVKIMTESSIDNGESLFNVHSLTKYGVGEMP